MQDGFSSNLNTPHKLNDVLDFILTNSMERFEFQMGVIVRFKKQHSRISHSINYGFSNKLLNTIESLRISDILQFNQSPEADIFIHNFPEQQNPRLKKLSAELSANSLNWGMTVLLKDKGKHWGALHLWHTQEIKLAESDYLEFAAFIQMVEMALKKINTQSDSFASKTRKKELITLNSIISRLHSSADFNGVLSRTLKETLDVLDLEAGGIYLIDTSKGLAELVTTEAPRCELCRQLDFIKLRNPSVTAVLQADKSLVTLELAFQSNLKSDHKRQTRIVTIPLRTRKVTLGFINLLVPYRRTFTSDEIYLLDSISKQVGVAVENRILNKKMERFSLKKEQAAA